MRHPREIDIPLTLDRDSGVPLSDQLVRQVRELVARGALCAGDPLPSSRALAARLGVSRGTVVTAWDVLSGEGYLTADRGATRIGPEIVVGASGGRPRAAARELPVPAPPLRSAGARRDVAGTRRIDLRPGRAPITELDTPAWRAVWRDAASDVVRGSVDGAGTPIGRGATGPTLLRQHLAEYLRLTRGVVREPGEVMITAGARDGLQLVLRVLGTLRGRGLRVAVEDPGYPALRNVVEATGHTALAVAVDEHGLDPARLPAGRWSGLGLWDVAEAPDAVVVTPGHQYPLGGTMPVSRRLELLRWAREHRAVVIEDDYDSDLRYTGQPVPALAALDLERDTVVTLGSFTKVLGGGTGVGHLVAPDSLLPRLDALRRELGSPVSAVAQGALARFMDSGQLQRHTARMRRVYRRRRGLLGETLGGLPGVSVLPMAGGAHAVVEVPDETTAAARAAGRGVLVSALGEYWAGTGRGPAPGPPRPRQGLVLGLTAAREPYIAGLRVLREILGGVEAPGGGH